MLVPRTLRYLYALTLFFYAGGLLAQDSITVAWQNSSAPATQLKDFGGTSVLTAGTSAQGDGAVLQLGYYTGGSSTNPFAGEFIALTGQGGANTDFASTSVGDSPGNLSGRFSLATTFVQGSPTAGQNLPVPGTPLVIRIYNRATVATATHYNEVSSGAAAWQWKAPSIAPGETVLISLSESGLIWRGVPFQTSIPVGGEPLNFNLTFTSANVGKAGGNVTVGIIAPSQSAAWTASTLLSWISSISPSSGAGSGSVTLGVSPNSGPARSGNVTIAGQVFTITQAAASGGEEECEFALTNWIAGFSGTGGNGAFGLLTSTEDCAWAAVSDSSWLTITSPTSGSGRATISYTVSSFTGPDQRVGRISVGGLLFKVVQSVGEPASTLTVITDGSGTVTGQLPTQRIVGKSYTLVAKPNKGAIFNGWSGTNIHLSSSDEAQGTLTFVMEENSSITAHFAPNPFALSGAATTYCGFVEGIDPNDPAQAGLLTLTITKTGSFTGKLALGGKTMPVKGLFTADGRAAAVVNRASASSLHIGLLLNTEALVIDADIHEGNSNGTRLATVVAPACSAVKQSAHSGSYTVLLPVEPAANFGAGFASLNVSSSGRARLVGKLPDGTAVTSTVQVDHQSGLALYVPLYKNTGFVGGYVLFRAVAGSSDADGLLGWVKKPAPASDKNPFYRNGFTEEIALRASRYGKPAKGVRAITLANQTNNALLSAEGGDLLSEGFSKLLTWDTANKLTLARDSERLTLKLNTATGMVSGSFIHDGTGKKTTLGGVILPYENRVEGLFLGSSETGAFSIAAPQP